MSSLFRVHPFVCVAIALHVMFLPSANAQVSKPQDETTVQSAIQSADSTREKTRSKTPADASRQESVTTDISLQELEGRLVRAEASIGSFLPGTLVKCVLRVTNDSDRFILFDNIENGCKCVSVEPKSGEIDPGESLEISLTLRVSSRPHRVENSTLMIFKRGRASQFMVMLNYSMRGIAGFDAHTVVIKVPKGSQNYDGKIPFYADNESPVELLELTPGQTLSELDFVMDYPNRMIRFSVPESLLESGRVLGTLVLRNLETDAGGEVLLDLSTEQSLELMPSVVRFRKDPEDNERFTARVLVINRLGDPTQIGGTNARFVFQDRALHADLIRDTGKAQNYSIQLPPKDDPSAWGKSERFLQCHIHGSGQTRTLKIPFLVDTSLHSNRDLNP